MEPESTQTVANCQVPTQSHQPKATLQKMIASLECPLCVLNMKACALTSNPLKKHFHGSVMSVPYLKYLSRSLLALFTCWDRNGTWEGCSKIFKCLPRNLLIHTAVPCGQDKYSDEALDRAHRIVGGQNAEKGEIGWQVDGASDGLNMEALARHALWHHLLQPWPACSKPAESG